MAPLPRERKSKSKGNGFGIFHRNGMPKLSLDPTYPRPLSALELGTRTSKAKRIELRESHQLPTASPILTKDQSAVLQKYHCHENILALERIVSVVGPLIQAERARGSRSGGSNPVNTVENFRIRRVGTKTEFWAPVLVLSGVQQKNGKKTVGFIRIKQSPFPFQASASGWTSKNKSSEDLLDSELWTNAVMDFARLIDFDLRKHGYDRERDGEFCACHVEKKLTLYFACDTLIETSTGRLNWTNIEKLKKRSTPLEAELDISLAPCKSCVAFMAAVQEVTGIKFTFQVCEGMVDDNDVKPCKKAKCKSEHTELVTARKKVEAEHKKLVAERKKCEALKAEVLAMAAKAKMPKKSKKAGWRARPRSTAVSVTINPNIMVVIPSKIVNVQAKIPRASKSQVTPSRPSSTPITPPLSPKAAKISHQTAPSTSARATDPEVPGKTNPPWSSIVSPPISPPMPTTSDKTASSVRRALSYTDSNKGDRSNLSLHHPPTPRSAGYGMRVVEAPVNPETTRKAHQPSPSTMTPLITKSADKALQHVQKATSYQAPKKSDLSTLSLISPPVSPPTAKPSKSAVLSVKNAVSYQTPRKADRDASSLISPPVSPPALITTDKPIVPFKKAPNYQTPNQLSKALISSSTFRQSENYRISKKPAKSSKYPASSFKSQTTPTMGTRSRGLHSQVSLFGFEGLEQEHKSKKDRSRDFSLLELFWD